MMKSKEPVDPTETPSRTMKNKARRLKKLQEKQARARRVTRAKKTLDKSIISALRAHARALVVQSEGK